MRLIYPFLGAVTFATVFASSLIYQSCASGQLTVEQASAQFDVGCDVLARVLSQGDRAKVERLRAQVCNSERTRELMTHVLRKIESEDANDAGADFLIEHYPSDAGH